MSNYTGIRQESTVIEQKQVTVPSTTFQYTSTYVKSERPDAYQFWHKKGKQNSYSSKVLTTNYKLQSQFIPGQSIQLGGCGTSQFLQSNCNPCGTNCCPQQQSPIVRLGVVSKDEIETPWRDEVLYLQTLIAELEKNKKVEIIKQVDNTRVHELEAENERLRLQIEEVKNEVITQRITETNTAEVDMWKKKFQEINHDYNEAQEELMNAEIELEALKKAKVTTTVTKSTVKTSSTVRSSGTIIKP